MDVRNDSPMLRDSLRRSFDGVAERGPRAKRLLRTLHDLSSANDAFSQAFSQFSRETCDFLGGGGGDGSPAAMGAALAQHIQLLSSVEESRRLMLAVHIAELEKTLEACANSSGALRDSFRGFQHACDRVDAAAARMAGAKPAKRAEETVRAEEAQRLHAAVAAKLQQGLLDASTGSALDIAERVYQLVHAHKTWMHASHESFLTLQGGRELHDQLELALLDERKAYVKQREAAARLETELQAAAISSSSSSSPPLPQQSQQSQQQGEFFSGHLFERVRSNAFKRRYCAIDIEKGQLQVFDASGAAAVPSRAIDLLLTSARVRADVGERVNLFEVLAPNRTLMFQAESAEGVARWMAALERARGEVLSRQTGQEASTEHTQTRDNAALLAALWNASPANRRCAECGASNPEWCSINLGVMFCLHCSGAHRNLGAHISKTRSLKLDVLEPEVLLLIARLGNARVNAILDVDGTPVDANASQEDIRARIAEKYGKKAFVHKKDTLTMSQRNNKFLEAAEDDDLQSMLYHLVHGANVDATQHNGTLSTALHIATKQHFSIAAAFLILHNAEINSRDARSWTPLFYAAESNFADIVAMLLRAGANVSLRDRNGLTPVEVAQERDANDCIKLLQAAALAKAEDSAEARVAFADALRAFEVECKPKFLLSGQNSLEAEIAMQARFLSRRKTLGHSAVPSATSRSRESVMFGKKLLSPTRHQQQHQQQQQQESKPVRPLPPVPTARQSSHMSSASLSLAVPLSVPIRTRPLPPLPDKKKKKQP